MLKFDFEFCLIPESMLAVNVRTKESAETWRTIRTNVFVRAGSACQICGRPDENQCHEHWKWDDVNRVQYLDQLVNLCASCHETVHLDNMHPTLRDLRLSRMAGLIRVRESRLRKEYKEQLKLKYLRSQRRYELDYSLINQYLSTPNIRLVAGHE